MKGMWALAIGILLLLAGRSECGEIVGVLGARERGRGQEEGRWEAWLHGEHGLVVVWGRGGGNQTALGAQPFSALLAASLPRPPLFLGNGALPAFDDNGDLYYQVSVDDGEEQQEGAEEWLLPRGALRPVPLPLDQPLPLPVLLHRRRTFLARAEEGREQGAPYRITIDAGHGGSDPGATAQGYQEKDLTLDISLRLRELLVADRGLWDVQMTRSTDATVSLAARTSMANAWPADRFVSIHINSFSSSSANGLETYSYQEGSTAARLRDRIQDECVKAWRLTDRGSKTANFYVLRETSMPATLSELGFITSPVDIQLLSDPQARQQIAAAHLYALQFHFGVSFNLPLLEDHA